MRTMMPSGINMRYATYMALYNVFIKYLEDPKLDVKDIMPDKIYNELYRKLGEPSELWIEHCNKRKEKLAKKRAKLYEANK